jgi:preprotein translocase subunit SecA
MYDKFSGLTGSADTEAFEFEDVYGLQVVVIPTHRPRVRVDERDRVYIKKANKYRAILREIKRQNDLGRPVLVGTESVKESDLISQQLDRVGLQHLVLNAKNHESEAYIVAQAGRPGAITISTNMAGRGTDIILGGNLKSWLDSLDSPDDTEAQLALKAHWEENNKRVIDSGGLCVIGTTRHQNRRIDNQLRGRSGRQGDPGRTVFFVSLQDDLMAQFGGQRYITLFENLNLDDDAYIEHRIVDKALSDAQGKLEGQMSSMRKEMLKYDDIVDIQRKEVYGARQEWLTTDDPIEPSLGILEKSIRKLADQYMPIGSFLENWDIEGFRDLIQFSWGVSLESWKTPSETGAFNDMAIHDEVVDIIISETEKMASELPQTHVNAVARVLVINCIDEQWREQIRLLDALRSGIHLRSYAQKQPIQEFGREAVELFEAMIEAVEVSYSESLVQGLHGIKRELDRQSNAKTEETFDK